MGINYLQWRDYMEKYDLKEYLHPTVGNFNISNDICHLVAKQLSRGRYELNGQNVCTLKIVLNNDIIHIFFDDAISLEEFNQILYGIPTEEPSLPFFRDFISKYMANNSRNGKLEVINILREYQNKHYKHGSEFDDQIWIKIYSDKRLENFMRTLYGAKWIDYEAQLSNGDIIFDEQHINGLWAMPYDVFKGCFNDACKENYGNKFFVLKTISDCKYLFDKKELIGDRFKVVAKSTLEPSSDFINMIELYNDLQKKSASIIDKLEREKVIYREDKEHLITEKNQLKKIIEKQIWISRILFSIIVVGLFYLGIRVML